MRYLAGAFVSVVRKVRVAQFHFMTRDVNPIRAVYSAYAFDSKYEDECRSSPGWAEGPSFPVVAQAAVKPKRRSWVGKFFEAKEGVYINANQIPSGIFRRRCFLAASILARATLFFCLCGCPVRAKGIHRGPSIAASGLARARTVPRHSARQLGITWPASYIPG